ncbi:39S ribosomal protein L28, mitochondrial [Microplitis mediator]|uniref:39S ribosomal protein L28, mitochondrial n=1 Tax=Microplitis mediator TaxID=375433 RepID=UPI002555CE24|nr:39S ribosomal protein L28, mitochondrial [Microplitis mediator]
MTTKKITNKLYYFPRPDKWTTGAGPELPEAYRKFWHEWRVQQPAPVHYIPEEGKYKFDELLGLPVPVQNVPIKLLYPKELDEGIWGGEAVVQGFRKKAEDKKRVARFWVPRLIKSVVYSEVLDKHMKTVVTYRTLELIQAHYGFDHYLLKTPACDLRSLLALRLKRHILTALADKTLYPDDPVKREEVYNTYKEYLTAYTREEIEWYGLSWDEAMKKHLNKKRSEIVVEPLKVKYRSELIAKLKEAQISEAKDVEVEQPENKSWLNKVNPFSKTPKA